MVAAEAALIRPKTWASPADPSLPPSNRRCSRDVFTADFLTDERTSS